MIPSATNPTTRRPVMTYALLAITSRVWVFVQGAGFDPRCWRRRSAISGSSRARSPIRRRSASPFRSRRVSPAWSTTTRSTISRRSSRSSCTAAGGTCSATCSSSGSSGTTSRTAWGPMRFLVFYLVCGLVAARAHIVSNPASPVPTVGASGAISGVMGGVPAALSGCESHVLRSSSSGFRRVVVLIYWFRVQVLDGAAAALARCGRTCRAASRSGRTSAASWRDCYSFELFAKPLPPVARTRTCIRLNFMRRKGVGQWRRGAVASVSRHARPSTPDCPDSRAADSARRAFFELFSDSRSMPRPRPPCWTSCSPSRALEHLRQIKDVEHEADEITRDVINRHRQDASSRRSIARTSTCSRRGSTTSSTCSTARRGASRCSTSPRCSSPRSGSPTCCSRRAQRSRAR